MEKGSLCLIMITSEEVLLLLEVALHVFIRKGHHVSTVYIQR